MSERDAYPAGAPCFVDISQPDPEAAMAFYGELFGWEFEDRMPADSPSKYFMAQLRGRDVAGCGPLPEGAPPAAMWSTYISTESADDTAAKVKDAGGSVLMEPFDIYDAGRMAVLADPGGAVFCVWQANENKGSQLVNDPGTWVFSDLNTRDLEGAKAFYGTVFGWEAISFAVEEAKWAMWRLPGYADFLEATSDPGLRRRMEEGGAPDGFEDAIAGLATMTSDRYPDDTPPHWSVTFSVDDADKIAERVAELGGKVVVPPFDAPPVRMAILSDPQGAVFSVSKYEQGS